MRRVVLVAGVVAMVMAIGVGSASAYNGGGEAPSTAPLVVWGQHYEASLTNEKGHANYNPTTCCYTSYQVAIYKLGPVSVNDQVAVNWHVPPAPSGEGFPVSMVLVENVDDFSWGKTFGERRTTYNVSGSGAARSEITVGNSSANDYLEFYARADETNAQEFETFQYDFSVEAPRHYIGLALGSVSKVEPNGSLHATATLANGGLVPDGYPVTLTGTWSGGVFTTTATTVAGQVTFPLAMPESSFGRGVEFIATGAATAEYQAAKSTSVYAEVTKPPAPPAPAPVKATPVKKPKPAPNLCPKATSKAHTLARQYKRQLKNAGRLHGRHRRLLLHRAHATERKFLAARSAKQAAC